jgi:hypothetical protein
MFDYVMSKPPKTEKPAWLGVLMSACWIFYGAVAVVRHRVVGWPIAVLSAFVLLMTIRRFVACRRDEAREATENRNG